MLEQCVRDLEVISKKLIRDLEESQKLISLIRWLIYTPQFRIPIDRSMKHQLGIGSQFLGVHFSRH